MMKLQGVVRFGGEGWGSAEKEQKLILSTIVFYIHNCFLTLRKKRLDRYVSVSFRVFEHVMYLNVF